MNVTGTAPPKTRLVGGWTNPLRNMCNRQIGSFPQGSAVIIKRHLSCPPPLGLGAQKPPWGHRSTGLLPTSSACQSITRGIQLGNGTAARLGISHHPCLVAGDLTSPKIYAPWSSTWILDTQHCHVWKDIFCFLKIFTFGIYVQKNGVNPRVMLLCTLRVK